MTFTAWALDNLQAGRADLGRDESGKLPLPSAQRIVRNPDVLFPDDGDVICGVRCTVEAENL